jgi:chemotaxis protein CheX
MSFPAVDLQRIVRTVWSTQLGLELETADAEGLASRLEAGGAEVVKIFFVGGFRGRLEQRCSPHVSLCAAAAAFAASGKNVGTSDIRDTVAEIANMTAGNLKSILPGVCDVAKAGPPIADDDDDGIIVARAGFTFEGEPLVVDVIQTA